ncbi:hypothetical protein PYCC9005_003876 [Savitreella phatthalungensis]
MTKSFSLMGEDKRSSKTVLAVNAGSSSVKASVFRCALGDADPELLGECSVSGLTSSPTTLTLKLADGTSPHDGEELDGVSSQEDAFSKILDALVGCEGLSSVSGAESVDVVVHRVVHGGDYTGVERVDKSTLATLERLSSLAPLHNGPALSIVKACHTNLLPHASNLACFDTAFHRTIPPAVTTYAIDRQVSDRLKLRKYGFHGISYAFITSAVAAHLGKPQAEVNLIALHLGSGASACVVRAGESVDTTMGLTPLSGLPGATRSGDVDPALVFHYAAADDIAEQTDAQEGLHITKAEQLLNKEAGWKAMTGTSDFGKIVTAATEGDDKLDSKACQLVVDMMVDRLAKVIGGYFVALEGKVDALVFAGGIGEKSGYLRSKVVDRVRCLGFSAINPDTGDGHRDDDRVVKTLADRILLVRTDEQLQMAREILPLLRSGGKHDKQ